MRSCDMHDAIAPPRQDSDPASPVLTLGDTAPAGGRVLPDLALALCSVVAMAFMAVLWPT